VHDHCRKRGGRGAHEEEGHLVKKRNKTRAFGQEWEWETTRALSLGFPEDQKQQGKKRSEEQEDRTEGGVVVGSQSKTCRDLKALGNLGKGTGELPSGEKAWRLRTRNQRREQPTVT